MSSYATDANIVGKLTKPSEQWFWWYNNSANAPNFQNEYFLPLNVWSLNAAASTGTSVSPANNVMSSTTNSPTGSTIITFPVKGKYTISFSVPTASSATNTQAWWTINTGYGVTGNTTAWTNSLGWNSSPNGLAPCCTFSGLFDAGDKVYPTIFSNAATSLWNNTVKRFSLSVVLDYRCA